MGLHLKILLSNDDGYRADGLRCLADALKGFASVTVVAPDRDRSGASNSLTLDAPLRVRHEEPGVICVDGGTPTDCVHLAVTGLLDEAPDMVVSGINSGANLGDDVLYSGTVAAAMEGRFLGFPAVAVSLVTAGGVRHYPTAARFACDLVKRLVSHPLPADTILNVNVPDLPWEQIRGVEATRLGHRHRSEPVMKLTDPRGRPIYWIGPPGAEQDAGPGTDFNALRRGCISVTPIQIDLTRYTAIDNLSQWLQGIPLK